MDVHSELDERIGDVRAHEAVRSGDERGASRELSEITVERFEIFLAPESLCTIAHRHLPPCRIRVFSFADIIEW